MNVEITVREIDEVLGEGREMVPGYRAVLWEIDENGTRTTLAFREWPRASRRPLFRYGATTAKAFGWTGVVRDYGANVPVLYP